MAKIVVLDLDNSNLVDLDNQKAEEVTGGLIGAVGGATGSILDNVFNRKPINWRSAGAWAVGGAIAGSLAGPKGAALAV